MTVNEAGSTSLLLGASTAQAQKNGANGKGGVGGKDAGRAEEAAHQFEALLIGQLLKSAREGSKGWLGTGDDAASSCAADYAEQQFAASIAAHGGLGMTRFITEGLKKE